MKKTKGTLTNLLMVLLMAVALATLVAVQSAQPEQGICLEKAPSKWIKLQAGERTGYISSELEQIRAFVQIDGEDYLIWEDDLTLVPIEFVSLDTQEVQSAPEDEEVPVLIDLN